MDLKVKESGWNAVDEHYSPKLDKSQIYSLSSKNLYISLANLLFQWVCIAICVFAFFSSSSLIFKSFYLFIIATRQHALLVLMHDGAHFLLAEHKKLNDLLSNFLCAFPIFVTTHCYRKHHFEHHRYLNTNRDPDLGDSVPPRSVSALAVELFKDLVGLNSLRSLTSLKNFSVISAFKTEENKSSNFERKSALAFFIVVLTTIFYFNQWFNVLVCWIVPMWFLLPPLLRLRALAEHGGRQNLSGLKGTRSAELTLLERFIFSPLNVSRHLEHHLFPSVPCYRLKKLSVLLLQDGKYKAATIATVGYFFGRDSLISELYSDSQAN